MSFDKKSVFVAPETNYFSVDDILASQQLVPCKVELPMYRLGFLDASAVDTNDLVPGTKLELPVWLALALCTRSRRIVSADLPRSYREAYREILAADATAVDLHKLEPYFYNIGRLLLRFQHADHRALALTLRNTFVTRYRTIMDRCQNSLGANVVQLTARLDADEKRLFLAGFQDVSDQERWQTRYGERMGASRMVRNLRKRRHAEREATATAST